MIRFTNAGYTYLDGTPALAGTSVEFRPSEITAVVGPNGAGKSTLAKMTMGLLLPTEGTVEIDGHDTRTSDPSLIRSLVGLAWQNPDNQLVCGVVEDDVAFGPENLGLRPREIEARIDEIVDRLGLKEIRSASIYNLSSAQKQVVAVAGAMAIGPRYLILDEVTARLDSASAHFLLEAVAGWARDHNSGVIMITHQVSEVLRANWVCRLHISAEGSGHIALVARPHEVLRDAKFSEDVVLDTPLYDTLFRLDQLGVHLSDLPDTVDGLVDALCR